MLCLLAGQAAEASTGTNTDLAIGVTASAASSFVGDLVQFNIGLTNLGFFTADTITGSDVVPSGFVITGWNSEGSPAAPIYDITNGVWTLASMTAGSTASLTITALATNAGSYTNTARITGASIPDLNPGNNVSSVVVTLATQPADLMVSQTEGLTNGTMTGAFNVGDAAEFSITIENLGPGIPFNITGTDLVPPEFTVYAWSSSAPDVAPFYDPNTGIWTLGYLYPNSVATLNIYATAVKGGSFTNTAAITGATVSDPNANNDAASVFGNVASPSTTTLAVSKTVSAPVADVGQFVEFEITVTNFGSSDLTNVLLQEALPPGLSEVGVGNFDPNSYYDAIGGLWYVTNLLAGSAAQLSITAQVSGGGPLTNTANLLTGGGSASAVVTGIPPGAADLAMSVSASADCVPVGSPANISLTVSHLGWVAASNIVVQEVLPGGVGLAGASVPAGTFLNSGNLQWTIPSLPAGGIITLTLTVVGISAGLETNTAYIVSSSPADNNSANNSASVVVPWSVDTTPPVLNCPGDMTVAAHGPAGGFVFYGVSAADDCDPAPAVSCSIPSGSLLPVGEYTAVCVATDASGNSNSCSFTITVTPMTPMVMQASLSAGNLVLQWGGGSPPYVVQMVSELPSTNWQEVMTTMETNLVLPMLSSNAFYRVGLADVPLDNTDYTVDRPDTTAFYTNDVAGYWVTNGIPTLARLADIKQDLGDDPMPAFEGLEPAYSEVLFTNALMQGLLPPDFEDLVLTQLEEGMTPWQALVSSLRTNVMQLDEDGEESGTNAAATNAIYQTIAAVFQSAFNPAGLAALMPEPGKTYPFPPATNGPDWMDIYGSDAFDDLVLTSGANNNNTNTFSTWDHVTSPPTGTTYNAACVAQAVGPCSVKLGLIGNNVSPKIWNDLSKDVGATAGGEGATTSGVGSYYNSKGYSATRAWNGLFGLSTESALEEAKAALDRGCDVLVRYSKNGHGHQEMVTGIEIEAGSKGYKGTISTLSWGQAAHFSYDNGSYSNKSDGRRYRGEGEAKSYLEGTGTVDLYYYCKK